ncbi:aminodeoxychorismate synthase component I [Sulfurimonas marina]|uniref:Aminodeoxychorismate synthase component I n=1 Tax=Sulfurimonas marina TaxID=2590551 RepID=A0A7M1ATB4_9BACT|nr:aminodeoxychorismate synthase component I [Sulfurimonas marina]QOP40654.1 aminodeoxychorismate synthase component I [Sulfurimonas marina]
MPFKELNAYGKRAEPFLFISDFKGEKVEVFPLDKLQKNNIEFSIEENYTYKQHPHFLKKTPIDFSNYKLKFDQVIENIKAGNTYILNLTQPTQVSIDLTLQEIYTLANAHYKLRYKDQFVCFSPEKFIQIKNNKIATFPMKGTIDASIEDAEEKILSNEKEMAEHIMIVDLLRNDLSIVAKDVRVEKFRYIDEIEAGEKKLLQVSSHISGELEENWQERIGDILEALLPAGSISGTPKKSTLELIEKIEGYERGHFSGVFGLFDGKSFDSGVMIRFIEKTPNGYLYKSGGGITLDSDAHSEYQEMLDKIYLP